MRVALFLVALVVVVAGALGAVWWYATSSYFVGLDDGRVAIFKGRPGGLLFIEPEVVEVTDLTEAAVPPARAADVEDGHAVSSLDDAQRYVRNLRRDSEIVSGTTATTSPASPTTEAPATTVPATTAP
jgi:protein phosphatase